jgi:hypothetical protein
LTKYKLLVALLCAVGATAVAVLLLGVTPSAFALLLPGLPFAIVLGGATQSDSPLILFASTLAGYSCLAVAAVFWGVRNSDPGKWRRWTIRLAIPVAILTILACIPTLDPLWPEGMTRMRKKEAVLYAIPENATPEQVRSTLKSEGIQFKEEVETDPQVVLSKENTVISANKGDRLIFTDVSPDQIKPEPDATLWPCRFDIQIVFLFDPEGKLKQRYVGHARLCP